MKHQPFIHILSVCLLFLSHTASGYAQSETLSEKLIVQKAVNLMEQGRYAESRALLEKIPETGTAYHIARYETAFSYILEKDYRKALKELKRIKEPGSLEWKYYQLSALPTTTWNKKTRPWTLSTRDWKPIPVPACST